MRQASIAILCLAALALAAPPPTTLRRMELGQLAAAAKVVVRAKCLGGESRWEHGEIWTETRFATLEAFKGQPPAEFTTRLLGGRVGAIESLVDGVPRFQPGEEVVLFLVPSSARDYTIAAWKEGTFRVRRNLAGQAVVTQDAAAPALYDRPTRAFRSSGVRRLPLPAFRALLRQVARQPAGSPPIPAPGVRP